ncbi:MAG: hypothetical protein IT578_09450 [Verrucomicrobiae bacterium]|nr:hypothetical protein [Verrucomicrobiae bacterium]
MSPSSRFLWIPVAAFGLALAGCETPEAPRTFISEENLAGTKEEALALAGALPSAEEIVSPAVRREAPAPRAAEPTPYVASDALREVPHATPSPKPPPPPPTPSRVAPSPAPDSSFEGVVVILNLQKGFVIVDFSNSKLPPPRSELGVYRDGVFVGTVRITPPIKPPFVSADILSGTLRRGDRVR